MHSWFQVGDRSVIRDYYMFFKECSFCYSGLDMCLFHGRQGILYWRTSDKLSLATSGSLDYTTECT